MTFRWLHISDIHFNFKQLKTAMIRASLLNYLKEINSHFDIDAVFITGDFRFAPEKKYEDGIITFLHNIIQALNLDISDLYIVPGNHDVNKSLSRKKIVNNILEEYDPYSGDIDRRFIKYLYDDKIEFIKFIKKLYKGIPERIKLYTDKNNPHFIVKSEKIDIFHIDTSLFSYKESLDEYGQLILGTKYIKNALDKYKKDMLSRHIIAIGHHPLSALSAKEYNCIFSIFKNYDLHAYLAGHGHAAEIIDTRRIDLRYQLYQIFSSNLYYCMQNNKINFLIGEYNSSHRSYTIDGYCWNSIQNSWGRDNEFGLFQRRDDNKCILYIDSIIGLISDFSCEYDKYIEKEDELDDLGPNISFANLIFAEKNYKSKMILLLRFYKILDIFFDNSVIFKSTMLETILDISDIKVDRDLMITLCLLYACGKKYNTENYIEDSLKILKKIGFNDNFCNICKCVDKKLCSERIFEGEILRFIELFGEFLLDNEKRKALTVKAALKKMCIIEKDNLALNPLIKAINDLESIKIRC